MVIECTGKTFRVSLADVEGTGDAKREWQCFVPLFKLSHIAGREQLASWQYEEFE